LEAQQGTAKIKGFRGGTFGLSAEMRSKSRGVSDGQKSNSGKKEIRGKLKNKYGKKTCKGWTCRQSQKTKITIKKTPGNKTWTR